MKLFTKLFSILAVSMLLTTGCITTPSGSNVPDPAVMTMIAQGAASIGTQTWLASHPNDREEFELARKSLRALIALGNGSPADLQEVLSRLPIKQLSGPDGQVIVSGAVILLDAAGKQLAKFDKAGVWSFYVEPVARGLLAGLDQALGPDGAWYWHPFDTQFINAVGQSREPVIDLINWQ